MHRQREESLTRTSGIITMQFDGNSRNRSHVGTTQRSMLCRHGCSTEMYNLLFLVSGMTQHDGHTRERDGDGSSTDEERVTTKRKNTKKVRVSSPKDGEADAGGNAGGDDDVDDALHEKVPSVE